MYNICFDLRIPKRIFQWSDKIFTTKKLMLDRFRFFAEFFAPQGLYLDIAACSRLIFRMFPGSWRDNSVLVSEKQ